jgi:hypothetical protein
MEDSGKPGHRVAGSAGAAPWTVNPSSVGVGRALSSQQGPDHTTDLVNITGRSEAQRVDMNELPVGYRWTASIPETIIR